MRIFSGVLFIASCLCALATSMYPLYEQNGTTFMTYTDIWGTAYMICAVAGILCLIINRKGLMLGASLAAALLAGFKFILLKLEVDNNKFAMSQFGGNSGAQAGLLDADPTVHHLAFSYGWNFYMFLGAAAAMLIFGFIYFCNAPTNDYR